MEATVFSAKDRKPVRPGLAIVAAWLVWGALGSTLFAEDDSFSDLGRGQWIMEFRLPDAYMPRGFVRDPNNRHWVVKTVDPDGAHRPHCHQYAVQPHAWVSNKRLSANPNAQDCPMGFGGAGEFVQRDVAGVSGFWRRVYQSQTRFQFNFMFQIGSCVAGFYMDASEATPVKGNSRFPLPSEQEIWGVVAQFVEGYRRYINDKGWTYLEGKSPSVVGVAPPANAVQSSGIATVPGVPVPDAGGMSDSGFDGSVAVVSLGTVAAGALTLLGAGLMMLGMGVSPRDVIDGAQELLGGGEAAGAKAEAVAREPLTEEQRGAAVRIWTEGWENVSSQEQELLRTSPEWLREAIKGKLPTETVEGYRRGWKEDVAGVVTPVLKVAQSGCDLAVGVFSKVSPGFGVSYTMFKNMAGGMSEGVHDWWWGSNDKGLVRNVAEGFTRGGLKGGVETAVDLAAGKLLGHVGGKYAMDPNNVGWKEFPWREALADVAPEYFAGQAGKYAVGAAGDAAVDWTDPPGSKHRPLRAEGFFDTTSPVEKDILDALLKPAHESGGMSAPPLPYVAQPMVY